MQYGFEKMGVNDEMLILIEANIAKMLAVRMAKQTVGQVRSTEKSDGTILTQADEDSTIVGCAILSRLGLPIWTEERKRPKLMSSTRLIVDDPVDGTRRFKYGAPGVSTISGIIDASGRAEMAIVAEVDTGRIFFARKGFGTWFFYYTGDLQTDLKKAKRCRVWSKPVKTGTVYLDLTPGFSKPGYVALSNDALGSLLKDLFGPYRPDLGPNGINLALAAFGREGVVGQLTTALGGPWDVIALLLMLEAGGYAMAFKDGEVTDPLLVAEYNVLVTAVRKDVLQDLVKRMLRALYPDLSH